jgi:hypothetical protein
MFKRPEFDDQSKLTAGTLKLVFVLIIALVLCTSLHAKLGKSSSDSGVSDQVQSPSSEK